ncbi:helix-turn-helix transcriptional regulator [Rossellomorea vietnamensis]|uniref:Helix-turn-helix transcriptional regulator n=1 Tax=Rossellomorea vietnamensis TaxID=218284 RepID=A0A5D4KBX9_9BACI|nr:helix-turn-helix transcriptional regulator [Rossellomorea vietnamensis]TYR74270.1 helix-turn-helix transcriptional regulator [Rossellomorea vietnamensis]
MTSRLYNNHEEIGVVKLLVNRVKEYRARFDLTQGQLAEKIGVTRQTIVSLEKGSYIPSLLLAMNIAEVFNEPIEVIFSKKEEEK